MANKFVIIAAGGSGTRIGNAIPKQFMLLHGKPLIVHTIEAFINYDAAIEFVIALPAEFISYYNVHISSLLNKMNISIVEGGKERFHSVKNALDKVDDDSLVGVQDAVRPFASVQLISRCFDAAAQHGSAIPVVPVNDSVRKINSDISIMLERKDLRAVQTPQCFQSAILKKAYLQNYDPSFTDDASVVEAMGVSVHLVEGERTNIKITTPEDLEYANWALEKGN